MAVSVIPLPAYPTTRTRSSLSPSQLAALTDTVASALSQTLTLPPAQCSAPTTRTFLSSYARDAACQALRSLIWNSELTRSKSERIIHQRVLLLADRLAAVHALDLTTLIDLCVTYAANSKHLRALCASALTPEILTQAQNEAVPAFTALLSAPSQGLYGLRKTSYILICLLRCAPDELVDIFARNSFFMVALAHAYDAGLATFAQSYGGLRLPASNASNAALDDWVKIFLETKVALLDAAHILLRVLLADASSPNSLGPALDVLLALLEVPQTRAVGQSASESRGTPFLDRPLLADYQHAHGLSRLLSGIRSRTGDARTESLESALQSLDAGAEEGPGALKLLLHSSGAQPGIDVRGRGPSTAQSHLGVGNIGKGKGRAQPSSIAAPEPDPALDTAVARVSDVLPDLDPGYVRFLLSYPDYPYRGDAERLLGALLEETAPSVEEVEEVMRQSERAALSDVKPVEKTEEFVYTKERRNIWDDQPMDLQNVRIGKKNDDASMILQDREQMKADTLRRAAEIEDGSEPEDIDDLYGYSTGDGTIKGTGKARAKILAFEEEIDDTHVVKVVDGDESELDGSDEDEDEGSEKDEDGRMRPETVLELAYLRDPKLFERDGQTRRSQARAQLKAQTGWSDEQIEGWRIMLERNPNKDKILVRHEFSGNTPEPSAGPSAGGPSSRGDGDRGRGRGRGGQGRGGQGRGGQGRGRGSRGSRGRGGGGGQGSGGGGTASDRARKDKNKASQANHDRKRGHDKKMARAGGPS
ncbi:hypothetical protein WOLCODRAFT_99330 [Wolfiporia cocos MD-104 SS10]|uniref:CUE domain-containing protein n=1 Tax=Wolfiporia cocos (strain MD-104) TaxID=742152 RepID=A0A2H3JPT3_WOLCO|nr:hypothetical protein WOLCODRAFT_99330 [Wolfiporia cocos MD-104 SS10]